jgi:hypothetical protein
MERRALKTAELAFADYNIKFIGGFANFSCRDSQRFFYCNAAGARDTAFLGRFVLASFQFLLLRRSKAFMFPEIFYLKH